MKIAIINKKESASEVAALRLKAIFKGECEYPYNGGKADLFVCFGGDGTILKTAKVASEFGAAVIAVNTGRLGFLSSFTKNVGAEELCDIIEKAVNGEIKVTERVILELSVENKKFYALNEIFVSRSGEPEARCESIDLGLDINGEFVYRFVGDGLIISTPTGSTAYSLSAGGAVLSPDVKAFIATPVCAHSMRARPVVFSDDGTAEISFYKKRASASASVYADGRFVCKLSGGDKARIKKSDKAAKIVNCDDFFDRLNQKMSLR